MLLRHHRVAASLSQLPLPPSYRDRLNRLTRLTIPPHYAHAARVLARISRFGSPVPISWFWLRFCHLAWTACNHTCSYRLPPNRARTRLPTTAHNHPMDIAFHFLYTRHGSVCSAAEGHASCLRLLNTRWYKQRQTYMPAVLLFYRQRSSSYPNASHKPYTLRGLTSTRLVFAFCTPPVS